MIGNMWRIVVLFPLLACLRQTVIAMPSTEELCAVIVDKKVIEECTNCFEEAGTLQQTPDDFRYCVGFSLPPMLAECSVRHHEEMRMQHGSPNIHPNHTNANLMPRCLTKAMLRLSRYIQREKIIARSGGDIVKTVATSTLVRQGGPALVGVVAQDALFAHAEMQTMIDSVASECLSKYQPKGSRNTEEEATRRMSLKTLKKALTLDPEEEVEEEVEEEGEGEKMEEEMEERKGVRSYRRRAVGNGANIGNNLPFGGRGQLAAKVMEGQCVIQKVIDSGYGHRLIRIISQEDFYLPIPSWLARPILVFYKESRELIESGAYD